MKILITGGTGFVGQKLVMSLLNSGNNVTCIVREDSRILREMGANVVICDLSDQEKIEQLLDGIDFVYYLAGSLYSSKKKEIFHVNSVAALNLYRLLHSSKVKAFIYLSSIAAVGPQNKPINEKTRPRPMSVYGKSKLRAETELKRAQSIIPIIIIRCPLIYGPKMNRESRLVGFTRSILQGKPE